jgi:membrane protease subunit (stomatin/prohibitin family)
MKQVWDRLRSELLLNIIEWSEAVPGAPDPSGDTLAWRFRDGEAAGRSSAIRNGAQLIVREGQWAVFLDEGRIADAFGPGRHTLTTANLPLLTSLLCLPTGFESPFKAEVVFVCTRLFSDLRWGTRQPLLLRDPELGPVRLRGFGSYSLRVNDPAWLVREVSGASGRMDLTTLQDPLRSLIVSRLADVLGRSGCPVFDLSSRYEWLARDLRLALLEDAQQFGLEIPSLLIEGLTLPPEVEAALVRRSVQRVEGESTQASPGPPPADSRTAPAAAAAVLPADGSPQPRPLRAPPPPPPLPGMARSVPPVRPAAQASMTARSFMRTTNVSQEEGGPPGAGPATANGEPDEAP